MNANAFCDGIRRRDFVRVGTAGLFGMGLPLSELLHRRALSPAANSDGSVIVLFFQRGLSTIDTIDLKPDAPAEIRGEFNEIDTSAPGVRIGEHLPRVARQMDKISLIRSFAHGNSSHGQADHYMLTGYLPQAGFNGGLKPNNQKPAHGAIIAHKQGPRGSVPPYVCLPKMHNSAGSAYLGPAAAPFVIEADPNAPGFTVPDLTPPLTIDADRLAARQRLLGDVDRFQKAAEAKANTQADAVRVFREKANDLMTSPTAKKAFDITAESQRLRDEYGRTSLGQSCLMARRLIEAGVRCVTIDHTNWDTHNNNFAILKKQLPDLDAGMSTLFRDLADRGMLETTMVIVTGEFGRTPRINKNAGRDHWGPGFTVAIGGGGVKGGRVVGASNARAEKPATRPHGPEDLAATMVRQLGINAGEVFYMPDGRPVKVVNDGRVIEELL